MLLSPSVKGNNNGCRITVFATGVQRLENNAIGSFINGLGYIVFSELPV